MSRGMGTQWKQEIAYLGEAGMGVKRTGKRKNKKSIYFLGEKRREKIPSLISFECPFIIAFSNSCMALI